MDVINFLFCAMNGAFLKKRNITKSCHEFWYMTLVIFNLVK